MQLHSVQGFLRRVAAKICREDLPYFMPAQGSASLIKVTLFATVAVIVDVGLPFLVYLSESKKRNQLTNFSRLTL